jgi:hypothetical protein
MLYEKSEMVLTVNVEPKVTFKDWYGLYPYTIDATFDFSKIPKELHQPFLVRLVNDYNKHRSITTSQNKEGFLSKLFNFKIF